VLQVFDGSPAAEGGLGRGDRIVEIAGLAVSALIEDGLIATAFGPAEEGLEIRVGFETRAGEPRSEVMRKRAVTIPTVSLTKVFDVDGRRVGYLFFRNFVRPSTAALDDAFATLREAGVTELVLDLRYNGGGLVDVAVHLGSLIGGLVTRDQVFAEYRHNDRNARRDDTPNALGLSRVIAITTRASASASELVINSLRPFVQVVIVGGRTYGKPVGQYLLSFCDKVLAPVSFSLVNANGQGDYFDGLPVDCPAPDDISDDLGSLAEASLAEALTYLRTGACSAPVTSTRSSKASGVGRADAPRHTGWLSLVNAY
jgi:C-terminal processing protease CtpA/Prc